MRLLLIFATVAALAAPAFAAERYTIDAKHSMPAFEINHLGWTTQRGRFTQVAGSIVLDRAAGRGSIDVTIDTASIDMGLANWDEHMRADDFFDVARFPTMRFTSDRLRFDGDTPVAAEGRLTLRGVTRPLTLNITHFACGTNPITHKPTCGADATATLRRSEFGMTKYVPQVSDEVKLLLPVEAYRADEAPAAAPLRSAD